MLKKIFFIDIKRIISVKTEKLFPRVRENIWTEEKTPQRLGIFDFARRQGRHVL
jgi:hypothetical protein